MAVKLIHIFKEFLAFIFPSKCIGCGRKNIIFCDTCLASLPDILSPENAWIFSATSYQNDLARKAIKLLKYQSVKILAKPLAELIYARLPNFLKETRFPSGNRVSKFQSDCLIIPIPLSKKRFRQRGYNQSELIAKILSDKMSVKMVTDVLYKIKETVSQVEIKDREKRLKNLEAAFAIKNPEIVQGRNIILVDDITTTGATLNEARRALKQAGAKKVIGLVVAKGG